MGQALNAHETVADHNTDAGLVVARSGLAHLRPVGRIEQDRIETRAYVARMAKIERIYSQRAELIAQRHEVRSAKVTARPEELPGLDRRERQLSERIDGLALPPAVPCDEEVRS